LEKPVAEFEAVEPSPGPEEVATDLGKKFQDALSQQREIWQRAASHAKDETTRFAKLRLDRTAEAVQSMDVTDGIKGVVAAQHRWLRDMINDYTSQSMRYTQLLRNIANNSVDSASETGKETLEKTKDVIDETTAVAEHASDAIGDGVNTAVHGGANTIEQSVQEYH
jgi:hypothetical protein